MADKYLNYSAERINELLAKADRSYSATDIDKMLNGLTFVKLTQPEYEAMETHDSNTVYIITEDENDTE